MATPTYLLDLSALPEASPEITGGKGAGLFQLIQNGFHVPPAWVVPTEIYISFLCTLGLGDKIAVLEKEIGSSPPSMALEAIREAIFAAPLPEDLLPQIHALAVRWVDPFGGQIILRSSATVEDQEHHSFAGIFESFTCASPLEIEFALRRVWASVFSPRAFSYYGFASLERFPAIAVVVQPFVQADRSGVMFTKFSGPAPEPKILVEFVPGSGDKLVTGQVNPERFWMPRWPSKEDLEPGLTGQLTTKSAFELALIARELENELGQPQDVEWCIQEETLFILQSRPITAGSVLIQSLSGGEVLLQGTGASPGHADGAVHLVFNIEDAFELQDGDILTTTMTNPDMVPMMQRSSAVVTDVGGMICHAAIISRELGIPCVVGTKTATRTVQDGDLITVDGSAGLVYRGRIDPAGEADSRRLFQWSDVWQAWKTTVPSQTIPVLLTVQALVEIPADIVECVLDPYIDLTLDPLVEITPLSQIDPVTMSQLVDRFLSRLNKELRRTDIQAIYLDLQRLDPLFHTPIARALVPEGKIRLLKQVRRHGLWEIQRTPGDREIALLNRYSAIALDKTPGELTLAVPLGFGLLLSQEQITPPTYRPPPAEGIFGMMPGVEMAAMPPPATRQPIHQLVPALAAAHGEKISSSDQVYPWLDLRPEVIITPFLKALVTPGVETIPVALEFDGPPIHIQFIRCRFHFRRDTLFEFFPRLLEATWDEHFLSNMLQRCRASYQILEKLSQTLPVDEAELANGDIHILEDRFVAWWRAFTEFFSSSFFIQAQGDDGIFPILGDMAETNASLIGDAYPELSLPGAIDLSAPVTPVLTAEYIQDLLALKDALDARGLEGISEAEHALADGGYPEVNDWFDRVLERWFWMRERDLYYDPYDSPSAILKQVMSVRPMDLPDYEANLTRSALALTIHFDLGRVTGNSEKIVYAVKYGRALALDRENHHIVWLRASYRLRQLLIDWERRLSEFNEIHSRDIFFFQPWEILEAVAALPQPLSTEMIARIRNRRLAYEKEIQLKAGIESDLIPIHEADYY